MTYPYNDEDLRYDYAAHRYILTLDYVSNKLGIDIQSRIASNKGINSTIIIDSLLNNTSIQIYNYLFGHNNKRTIEFIIAKAPSARDIIRDAMSAQLVYLLSVGDMTKSLEDSKRSMWLDMTARAILNNQEVEETGVTLTYTGRNGYTPIRVKSYAEGNY